jgi:hypothetical protein
LSLDQPISIEKLKKGDRYGPHILARNSGLAVALILWFIPGPEGVSVQARWIMMSSTSLLISSPGAGRLNMHGCVGVTVF